MNSPPGLEYDSSPDQQQRAPAAIGAIRLMYWSVRREIWENRSIYIAPVVAATLFLAGFVIHTLVLRRRMHGVWNLDAGQKHDIFAAPHEYAAIAVMVTAFVVGIFYTLDALYGERRDRSILFWKSLPVSDLITVLAKVVVPLFIIPLLSVFLTLITQFIMLLLGSVVLLGSGVSLATVWTASSPFHSTVPIFYHILTIHGLWYAPFYAWLLLASAWAPRAPILWAVLPPFAIWFVEKIAFNTSHFLDMLKGRLMGPAFADPVHEGMMMVAPATFFVLPGLWIGLAIAAVFLTVAVRLRRYRGPI